MNRLMAISVMFVLAGYAGVVDAYNLETHAFMTDAAFRRSILSGETAASNVFYQRLGLDRLTPTRPFNQPEADCDPLVGLRDHYVDARAAWDGLAPMSAEVRVRCPQQYEQLSMPPAYTGLLPTTNAAVGSTGWLRFEGWLMRGVIREDDVMSGTYDNPAIAPDQDPWLDEFRSVHHFYDPVSDTPGIPLGTRSTTWALGVADQAGWENSQLPDGMRTNHFSYMDARKLYWLALTFDRHNGPDEVGLRADSNFRQNLLATTLKALGQVVHMLQDSASPQHVRGERHSFLCNGGLFALAGSDPVATRTFENFSNYRVAFPFDQALIAAGVDRRYSFSNFCDDDRWRNMFESAGQSPPTTIAPWTDGNSYPVPQFAIQRRFFTTRAEDAAINARRGLVDYSNRGFFTEGNFAGTYASPPANLDSSEYVRDDLRSIVIPDFPTAPVTVFVRSLYWRVPDVVSPNYTDPRLKEGRAPIASYGVWADIADTFSASDRGHLSLDNYVQVADMLAPRAIAYTTGMLNFFFRGELTVEAPIDGLFGAIDHSIPHQMNNGYPVCMANVTAPENWCTTGRVYGFTKIRLKVRNSTVSITESGTGQVVAQTMDSTVAAPVTGTSAGLYAVARYHRNPCYKPDLSGDITVNASGVLAQPQGCMGGVTRTDFQEISVSKPLVMAATDLNGSTASPVVFDFFDDPIPVNATDLIIQVVYRGRLGQETDGIAIGAIDVREPSYVTAWNNSDYGGCNGAWHSSSFPAGCGGLTVTFAQVRDLNLCVGSQLLLAHTLSIHGGLQVDDYLRVAVLLDSRSLATRGRFVLSASTEVRSKTVTGQIRQSALEVPTAMRPFVSEPFFKKRGRVGSFRPVPFYRLSGTDPQPLSDMGALDVGNLTPDFTATELPKSAEFQFPNVAVSSGACPAPSP